jgi:Fe-S-cluster containining protein
MSTPSKFKTLRLYVNEQAKLAQADLDKRMSEIPKACQAGCDACCYQMVSVHTWEEGLIGDYVENSMHAKTKTQVRKQLIDWWRHLKAVLRPSTRDNPISLAEFQQLTFHMIHQRVMCPFLVDKKCSIYPVRPAMCRAHVVSDEPDRCTSELGRVGEHQGAMHMLETFGPESPHLPVDQYFHSMKPLAFEMTGALKVPVQSTPMLGVALGDLIPASLQ